MPRNVRTARGEIVDFDAIVIKQQIAEAPTSIEVSRRQNFIDSKEGTARQVRKRSDMFVTNETVRRSVVNETESVKQSSKVAQKKGPRESEFELDGGAVAKKAGVVEAVPIIPERNT